MKAISLFSGMGGDTLGMKNAGIVVVAYSEIDKIFQQTHNENFKNCKLIGNGDILKTKDEEFETYKDIDLIFAGFPCQGFSQAGKKLPEDPRNTLFREFVRATKLCNPKYIIGENVKGLLTRKTKEGNMFIDIIKEEFENLGYNITYKVLKCHEYGVPQKRERLFIIGVKDGVFEFPEPFNNNPNLKDIVEFDMRDTIKIENDDFDFNTLPKECIITDMDNDQNEGKPHPNLRLLAKDKNYTYAGKTYERRLSFGKRDSSIHGEIVDIRNPSKTIICTYGRQPRLFVPITNKNGNYLRCFNVDELKQIQGFPKDFIVCGNRVKQITQIGNAVPPPIVKLLCDKLLLQK